MDINQLTRDAKYVLSTLRELEDNSLVATKETRVYFPSRFIEQGLAAVELDTTVIGILAFVVGDKYSVLSVNAPVRLTPIEVTSVMIRGEEYQELLFTPGSTVMPTMNAPAVDEMVYRIYNGILAKGRVPWYLSYDKDMPRIFDTAGEYAGAGIGQEREITELLLTILARDPDDLNRGYRFAYGNTDKPARYISIKTVEYTSTNAFNKLGGANFNRGVVAALVSPTTQPEPLETLLRL